LRSDIPNKVLLLAWNKKCWPQKNLGWLRRCYEPKFSRKLDISSSIPINWL